MKSKIAIVYFLTLLMLPACIQQRWMVTEVNGKKIPIGTETEVLADQSYKAYLAPFKLQLDQQMNEVIGIATNDMPVFLPESPLSNFSADVYKEVAEEYLKAPIDIAIVNVKGLRTNIPAGPIKVSKVFELMPFENELVIVWLKGSELYGLLNFFASIRGEGVAGLRMGIKDGKAVDVLIGGKVLDPNKVYSIATNDYLAQGNDGMVQLEKSEKQENTGVKIRDMIIDYIRKVTAKGEQVTAKVEGRITVY